MINVHVWEVDELLEPYVSDPPTPADFIYFIDPQGEYIVFTPRSYWLTEGACFDQHLGDVLMGIAPACADIFDDESQEAEFIINGLDPTAIGHRLQQAGFGTDVAFDAFMM